MSTKTRRGSAIVNARKEKEIKPEEPVEELEEDDDGPPPVLERETSCGENDDAEREMKEAEAMAAQIAQRASEDEFEENAMKKGCENLLQALSHVFSAEDASPPGRKRRASPQSDASKNAPNSGGPTRGLVPKALLLNKTVRPAQTPSTSTSSPSTRFTSLRHLSSASGTNTPPSGSGSTTGNRKYGLPPPIPRSLRNINSSNSPAVGVGSNTSLGPARLLENRKRQMEKEPNGTTNGSKRPSLVAYNGGRAGENFRKVPSAAGSSASSATSTSSSTTAFDVQSMLRDQSPVRMQVSVGGDHERSYSMQEALELASLQRETIGSIAKESSNHSMLLGSMILNGLNTLHTRNPEEYNSFSADLFSLITKYSIH